MGDPVGSGAKDDIPTLRELQSDGQYIPTLQRSVRLERAEEPPNPTSSPINEATEDDELQPTSAASNLRHRSALVRSVFRSIPHPVAIVTALAESQAMGTLGNISLDDQEDPLDQVRAMTVSSLNTVSLNPVPIISFNVRTPSSTWDAISATKQLRVHTLKATERGAELAASFSKGDTRAGLVHELSQGMTVMLRRTGGMLKLAQRTPPTMVETDDISPNEAPNFRSNGFSACLHAELLPQSCVTVNDHVIVVAEVKHISYGIKSKNSSGPVLSYWNHQFVKVSDSLENHNASVVRKIPPKETVRKARMEGDHLSEDGLVKKIEMKFARSSTVDIQPRWVHFKRDGPDDSGNFVASGVSMQ